jgi:hypothetical protein
MACMAQLQARLSQDHRPAASANQQTMGIAVLPFFQSPKAGS